MHCFYLSTNRCIIPSLEDYNRMLEVLDDKPSTFGKNFTAQEYAWRRKFVRINLANDMVVIMNESLLRKHVDENGKNHTYSCPRIISQADLFQAILDAHEKTGHAKSERTYIALKSKYSNIPRSTVEMFIGMCPVCALDKIRPSRKAPHQPILSKTYNDRGQIDLIDMQSTPDGPFRWILHYQDHLTKFTYLRPLRKKSKKVNVNIIAFTYHSLLFRCHRCSMGTFPNIYDSRMSTNSSA